MNIIDLMINHNIKCTKNNNQEELITNHQIIGHIIAFQFAGKDTTLHTTTSGLMHMAKNDNGWFKKIIEDGIGNLDQIMSNKSLDNVINEILRLYHPSAANFERIVTKEFYLGGLKMSKGDQIGIPVGWGRSRSVFKNPEEFRPERFNEEVPSLEYGIYSPFYGGKRKCPGYAFAEMKMKMMIAKMLNTFEMKLEDGYEILMDISRTYYCANPKM